MSRAKGFQAEETIHQAYFHVPNCDYLYLVHSGSNSSTAKVA